MARRSNKIYVKLSLLESQEWLSLNSTAAKVFLIFLLKRKFKNISNKRGKKRWVCVNIDNIDFPISEAKKYGLTGRCKNKKTGKHDIDKKKFRRSRNILVEKDFLRIVKKGGIIEKDGKRTKEKTVYGLDTNFLKSIEKQGSRPIPIEKKILTSMAWLSLSASAIQVYLLFLTKVQYSRITQSREPIRTNINNLYFTYKEALEKYGITNGRFKRAIDELIEKGFIDINSREMQNRIKQGGDRFNIPAIYILSDRWKKWGTKDFIKRTRRIRDISVGYCKPKQIEENLNPTTTYDPYSTYVNNLY